MPSAIPFFEKAEHRIASLRKQYSSRPRLAAWKLAVWALGKALSGNILGDVLYTKKRSSEEGPISLAVMLRGGIGDEVMSLAYIYELVRFSGMECHVDIFSACSPTALKAVCYKQPFIDEVYSLKDTCTLENYDAVLDILRHAQVKALCSERLTRQAPKLHDYLRQLILFQEAHKNFYTDENQAMGLHYAEVRGTFRRGQADFDDSLGLKDSDFTLNSQFTLDYLIQKFGISPGYITIQREAGANPNSTKLWASHNYTDLLKKLRVQFPTRMIVLIGIEKNFEVTEDSHILDLRGLTDFSEFMAIVKHAVLHIGCEGIVPHLRHYLHGGPSIVLFGPSSASMLGYPENIACSGKECPGGCEGIQSSWQDVCMKGYDCCKSIGDIKVDDVIDRARSLLS